MRRWIGPSNINPGGHRGLDLGEPPQFTGQPRWRPRSAWLTAAHEVSEQVEIVGIDHAVGEAHRDQLARAVVTIGDRSTARRSLRTPWSSSSWAAAICSCIFCACCISLRMSSPTFGQGHLAEPFGGTGAVLFLDSSRGSNQLGTRNSATADAVVFKPRQLALSGTLCPRRRHHGSSQPEPRPALPTQQVAALASTTSATLGRHARLGDGTRGRRTWRMMVASSTAAGKASRKKAQRRWVSSSRTEANRAGHTSSSFSM